MVSRSAASASPTEASYLATGLLALLDDISVIAKAAAASIDDALGQSAIAGAKAAGVVIDDAAVTPGFVAGLDPKRELPIVGKIGVFYYFFYFLIVLPFLPRIEVPRPLPTSISESVLRPART